MNRYVAQRNIDRFKALLDKEAEPAQRRVIQSLLDAEQEKLDELDRQASQAKHASRT